ncbi:MAG TPA: OB-fold nucleic acid binding domain-containing protein, partial [Methanocorpusculum sp.]|nr:OB-fold nucleic acid binding domain-containing protein [Methanocorpusculum sp.]
DLGRAHIKIGDIPHAETKIVSFYGKVLSIDGPREFTREGEEEPGAVANLILGDPSGTTKMTLWDEKAQAMRELKEGDVVEVIAQPHHGKKEVGFVAMRESNVEIVETKKPPKSELMAGPLNVRILSISPVREIEKKDGGIATLQTFLVGDSSGTARMITWMPEIFADVDTGASVSISGVIRNEDDGIVEYTASDTAEVTFVPPIDVLKIDADDVEPGLTPVVTGTVVSTLPIKTFVNRRGKNSKVRNLRIKGKTGRIISVALWNEAADTAVIEGDSVEIINAEAKPGKFTEIELSVGYGSALTVVQEPEDDIECTGMVQARNIGMTLDTADGVWILCGDNLPEPGTAVTVYGTSSRGRITVDEWEPVPFNIAQLKQQAELKN